MKGISFSEPMVRAWMEERKMVTRRLMKPQPDYIDPALDLIWGDGKEIKPPYRPGETVYIKETWCPQMNIFGQANEDRTPFYKADSAELPTMHKWRSPRFMPEWAARSHARIVSVRPERVQEITNTEAVKEGFPFQPLSNFQCIWESLHKGSWAENSWVWRIELEKLP